MSLLPSERLSHVSNFLSQVTIEYNSARAKFPEFHSAHEGFAILKEEVDELWDVVKGNKTASNLPNMYAELIQIAAMACAMYVEIDLDGFANARS